MCLTMNIDMLSIVKHICRKGTKEYLSDLPAIRCNVSLLPKHSMRAMISLLYPQSVLEPRMPDELFREETDAMAAAGHNDSLRSGERLDSRVPQSIFYSQRANQ